MDLVVNLWQRLQGKQDRGGRLTANCLELRAMIFAVRVTLGLDRLRRRTLRRLDKANKIRLRLDPASAKRLLRSCKQTISSLERHMKCANRRLRALVSSSAYNALVDVWRQHLRWMRLNLVYFKPLPPISHSKRRQQRNLDTLTDMAIRGLKNEGLAPPEPRELRRVMRLYVRSSNRGREGINSVPEMLRYPKDFNNRWFLAQWVISRTNAKLEPLP
jgi:hypothetical protein